MKLNLYLYKENNLIYSLLNHDYELKGNIIHFTEENTTYEITITKDNFIFKRADQEHIFTINYQTKSYTYLLKEIDSLLDIPCNYQNYLYNNDKIIFEYLIASDEMKSKIIIERM